MRDGALRMLQVLSGRVLGNARVAAGAGTALAVLTAALAVTGSGPMVSGSMVSGGTVTAGTGVWPATGSPGASGQPLAPRSGPKGVRVTRSAGKATPALGPVGGLLQADLLVVGPAPLSPSVAAAVGRLPGVTAAQQIDAARIQVDGKAIAMLGVDPSAFRVFAAQPVADATGLWRNIASGGIALSYTMGTLDKVPAGRPVRVDGRRSEELPLAGLGTVGIAGVDAVVSDAVARSLGIPAGNAIVVSAPEANLATLAAQVSKIVPHGTSVAPLVAQAVPLTTGPPATLSTNTGPGLTAAQTVAFLKAAESRLGKPYVWGGDGPDVFDCSGLVQWSMAQAGIVMPRVAADQALTGPSVPVSQLQPGDLLFYHTDPTAPDYISHVAIYLGDGVMLQAPEPGLDVEAVPASFGSEFAGAVRVYPQVAAAIAAESV